MIAGLPGTGIGGMFYAITTLSMPFREMAKQRRGEKTRWNVVVQQLVLATIVIGTMWITGDLVGRLIAMIAIHGHHKIIIGIFDAKEVASGKFNILTLPFLFWTLGSITLLHLLIHAARLGKRFSARKYQES